ncbi:Aldo/keto reductase [Marasmius fiardii PR-910]|nr:Aldo/keto reductase [Marasmius fiardii PR-910]
MNHPRKMTYVNLGNSGLKISRIVLGMMQYGSSDWQPWILGQDEAISHIKAAYNMGIQTFDTANIYSNGVSERILGNAIKELNLPRDEIVVVTKVHRAVDKKRGSLGISEENGSFGLARQDLVNQSGLSRKHIFDSVKASLERLQLDYIDLLCCHRFDPNTPIEETMTALHDVVKAGYVRYIGMGACYAWQFHQMQNYAITKNLTPFICMQNQYSLIYRDDEIEMYPTLKLFGVGAMTWSPLARGYLARPFSQENKFTLREKSDIFHPFYQMGPWDSDQEIIKRVEKISISKGLTMAQVSLAWILHKKSVTAPTIGATSIPQIQELVDALHVSLSTEELEYLEELYQARPKLNVLTYAL